MIRDRVFYEECSAETYQRIASMKKKVEAKGIEVTTERVVVAAIEVAEDEKWLKKLLKKE